MKQFKFLLILGTLANFGNFKHFGIYALCTPKLELLSHTTGVISNRTWMYMGFGRERTCDKKNGGLIGRVKGLVTRPLELTGHNRLPGTRPPRPRTG